MSQLDPCVPSSSVAEDTEQIMEVTTVLGVGSTFEGKLYFKGATRIDGDYVGEIESDHILVVGETGHVSAQIRVATLIVEGLVEGNIFANQSVEIHSPGHVRGNIVTPSLFVDRGVVFEGNCQLLERVSETSTQAEASSHEAAQPDFETQKENASEANLEIKTKTGSFWKVDKIVSPDEAPVDLPIDSVDKKDPCD